MRKFAIRVEQREVLLILAHRQDQAFLWHAEKSLFEFADVNRGEFDQGGHLIEQRCVIGIRSEGGLERFGLFGELPGNFAPALVEIGDDVAFVLEPRLVFVGAVQ
jgi:hypothetical protein